MRPLTTVFIFFAVLIVLMALLKTKSGFRGGGGEAIGGHTAGPNNIGDIDGFRGESIGGRTAGPSNIGSLEDFRGGQAIGGHTAGPNNIGDLEGEEVEGFADLTASTAMWGTNPIPMGSTSKVSGVSSISDGPADATLNTPRKPYNLLDYLPPAPRGSISCLKASCCAETDFEERTMLTGNYLQRTNNYKREFPDNCTGPLHEFTLAFYKNNVMRLPPNNK